MSLPLLLASYSMNLSIYAADETSAPRAFELMKMAFDRQRRFVEPEPDVFKDSIGSMSAAVARGEKRLVVALHRKRLLGCLLGSPNEESPEDYYFGRLAVYPRYQGNNIGSQLIEDVESWAQTKGYKRVTCHVRKSLAQNIAYFERHGYAIYGEGTHDGFDEPTFYKMGKTINASS